MAPAAQPFDADRPARRLRLAAALGGAGVLAVGMGAGVLQAHGDDPAAQDAAPGAAALAGQQPRTSTAPAPAAVADDAPNPAVSSTPLDPPPAPAQPQAETPAAPVEQPAAPQQEVPAPPEQPAAPQREAPAPPERPASSAPPAQPEPPTAEAAAPAAPQPPAETAAATPAQPQPPAAEAAPAPQAAPPRQGAATTPRPRPRPRTPAAERDRDRDPTRCGPGEEAVLTLQGADGITCEPKPSKAEARRRAVRAPAGARRDPARSTRTTTSTATTSSPVVNRAPRAPAQHNAAGVPTLANPSTSLAVPGPAAVGVPNFFIDKFRIPPFLLSIYQAAGMEYGIRWEILAGINEIETDYGRNLNVSSAGALGWMQFMPATWRAYGVDANGDGRKDPYNPVDAIFAAARYLKASGGQKDLRRAIFAYNHADWYVDSVLMRARLVGGLPEDLVGSLTGLTQGRFPVAARARYAGGVSATAARTRIASGNAAVPVESDSRRREIDIFAAAGSPAVATHDGTVVRRGTSRRLGRYVVVRDRHGNRYTYGHLGSLEASHPVARRAAEHTREKSAPRAHRERRPTKPGKAAKAPASAPMPSPTSAAKERLFAHPERSAAGRGGAVRQLEFEVAKAPQAEAPAHAPAGPVPRGRDAYAEELLRLDAGRITWKRLKPGAEVIAGTILGRVGAARSSGRSAHLRFEIRPAGRGAPRIDPKPILDGWKLLETTAVYRAKARNPFFGREAKAPTIGQILLMGKTQLQKRVLADPRISIYSCGRTDIRSGRIDRRVLATLEFLAANGLKPTVTSLQCGHGTYTTSGNVSHHTTGTGLDIGAINGIPITGHQGSGSITDITIRRLLTLQGVMKPAQIISLMTYPGTDNTLAMGDHHDHIHVGWRPSADTRRGSVLNATLKPGQWFRIIDRLNDIENPVVRAKPSKVSLKVRKKP